MRLRAQLIRAFDQYVKRTKIHKHISVLNLHHGLPQDEQLHIQQSRLVHLLEHASQHVPYYREVLRTTGIANAEGGINLSCYYALPFITKDIIRDKFDALTSDDLSQRRWYFNSTGGSTGEPLRFIQDQSYSDFSLSTKYFNQEQVGIQLDECVVMLWGSQREIIKGSYGWRAKFMSYFRNIYFLNCFRMSPKDMRSYVRFMQNKQPVLIVAYADGVYMLSRFMNAHNLKVPSVKAIITGAGTLLPTMRDEIERAFGCEVFNRYGSREMGDMAFDHPSHEYLDVSTFTHLVEVVDHEGNPCKLGQEGEIIVTCLTNFAMPFIRYRIGDTGIVKQQIEEPIASVVSLSDVTGRVADSFVRRNGTVISPNFFIHFIGVVHNSGWVNKTQIIQLDYDRVKVKLLTEQEPPEGAMAELERSLKKGMGDECLIEFEFCDELPPSESGKYRYTISHVKRP